MKATIKKDFLVREIAGEKVLIGNGEQINFSKMLVLNDTAAYLIEELQKRGSAVEFETLANCLAGKYDVEFARALADDKALIKMLEEQGVDTIELILADIKEYAPASWDTLPWQVHIAL